MIFKIDISREQAAAENREQFSELISEAARASLLGYHRVVISRSLAKWCVENLDLTERHKRHVERIGQNYTQLGGQVTVAKLKILIRSDVVGVCCDGDGTWRLGLGEVLLGEYFSPTSLILEHAVNDGDFYRIILSLNAKLLGFGETSFVVCHGGGNGCAQELARISRQKKVIACICDTDLKAPGGARSATFNSVMAEFARENPVGIALGTPGREAENFLPPSIVREVTNQVGALDRLEALICAQGDNVESGDCLWLYFDVKDGIPLGCFDSYCRSEEARNWIREKFDVQDNDIGRICFPSLGENVLSAFMNSERLRNDFHRHIRSRYWSVHFLDWVQTVLWAVAGQKPERAS